MGDPSNFANGTEYDILMYAVGLLVISEGALWIISVRGKWDRSKKGLSRGTIWMAVLGWCCCIMAGPYFRGDSVPAYMRDWLLPHFAYYIGVMLIIAGIVFRVASVLTLKNSYADHQIFPQTGLYHIVRNPAYTGSLISLLGVAFAYRHMLGIAAAVIICVICFDLRVKTIENTIKIEHQKEFEQYCSHTKRKLIPGIF